MPRSLFSLVALSMIVLTGCSSTHHELTTAPQPTPTTTSTTSTTARATSTSSTTTQTTTTETPMQNQEPQQQAPVYQTPAYQAPVNPPAAQADPGVSGYTGAPNGAPQPLDKTISYCMNDPIYQPGTTMFTDGTTGWTTYCAGM